MTIQEPEDQFLVCQWPSCNNKFGVDPQAKVCRAHKAQWEEFIWLLDRTLIAKVPIRALLGVVRASIEVEEKPQGLVVPGLGQDVQEALKHPRGG